MFFYGAKVTWNGVYVLIVNQWMDKSSGTTRQFNNHVKPRVKSKTNLFWPVLSELIDSLAETRLRSVTRWTQCTALSTTTTGRRINWSFYISHWLGFLLNLSIIENVNFLWWSTSAVDASCATLKTLDFICSPFTSVLNDKTLELWLDHRYKDIVVIE